MSDAEALQQALGQIRLLENEKAALQEELRHTQLALQLNSSLLKVREPSREAVKRISNALQSVWKVDGDHHKQWVIDQMVRHLTGCPMIDKKGVDHRGNEYTYQTLGESEEYLQWVRAYCDGEDGPETYEWDEGTPP